MKLTILTVGVLFLCLGAPAIPDEAPAASKCEMCEAMKKKAAAPAGKEKPLSELAEQAAELDKLVTEMNGSIGSKKIEAMAAVVTRLVEQSKTLQTAKPESPAHQH